MEEKGTRVGELVGQHRYSLDAKGRIALPGKFRDAFGDGLYLTLGQERCLYAFPKDEWERQSRQVRTALSRGQEGRAYERMFFSNAEPVELDKQGRVVIPQRLRAQIALDREAVVIGVWDRMEIWNAAEWDRYEQANAGAYATGVLAPEAH